MTIKICATCKWWYFREVHTSGNFGIGNCECEASDYDSMDDEQFCGTNYEPVLLSENFSCLKWEGNDE